MADIFDELDGDVFDVISALPSKEKPSDVFNKAAMGLNQNEILYLVNNAISKMKPIKEKTVVEKVIEKHFERKKDDKVYAEENQVKKLERQARQFTTQLEDLKNQLSNVKEILPMLGGSGVIGLPTMQGQSGKFLTTDGNQPSWSTVTQGNGTSTTISLGNPTTEGSWQIIVSGNDLSFQRRESGSWVEKASMNP